MLVNDAECEPVLTAVVSIARRPSLYLRVTSGRDPKQVGEAACLEI